MSDAGLATSAMRGGGRRARILGHRRGSFSAAASITANPTFHEWDVQLVNDPWVPLANIFSSESLQPRVPATPWATR
jgi:hypothetical protein